jgi:DNA-binding transcriptional regulator PaaX
MLEKNEKEVRDYKAKMSKEVKGMRESVNNLSEENQAYKKVIEEMSIFFRKIVYE